MRLAMLPGEAQQLRAQVHATARRLGLVKLRQTEAQRILEELAEKAPPELAWEELDVSGCRRKRRL